MRLFPDFSWGVGTVWAEARGEPYAGKIAVGNTVRNIAKRDGVTIAEAVLYPRRFSCWNSLDPNRIPAAQIDDTDTVVHECIQAWLASAETNLIGDATLYLNLAALEDKPEWLARVTEVARIGKHTFFREGVSA